MTGAVNTNTLSRILASDVGPGNYSQARVFWKTRIFLIYQESHGGFDEEAAVASEGKISASSSLPSGGPGAAHP